MVLSNAYNYVNVLGKAADASWTRNDILANNIANADTPGFKRKDVQFETYLKNAVAGTDSLNETVANIDLNELNCTTYTDQANLSYRYDGNNVDIKKPIKILYAYEFYVTGIFAFKICIAYVLMINEDDGDKKKG